MSVQIDATPEPRTDPQWAGPGGGFSIPEAGHRKSAAAAWGVAGLLGLVSFAVYFRTLAPSIVGGDSPELAAAACTTVRRTRKEAAPRRETTPNEATLPLSTASTGLSGCG